MSIIENKDYKFCLFNGPYNLFITVNCKAENINILPVFDSLVMLGYQPMLQPDKSIIVNSFTNIAHVLKEIEFNVPKSVIVKEVTRYKTHPLLIIFMILEAVAIILEALMICDVIEI